MTATETPPAEPVQPNSIDEAKKMIEELKEQNQLLEKNLARAERLEAERIIQGRADGGQEKKPKELTDQEYSAKVLAGEIP
jgi:hypothetical protein